MYCYLVTYSFCAEKIIHGPYQTKEQAFERMLTEAQEEYRIDTEEMEKNSKLRVDTNTQVITLTTPQKAKTKWEVLRMED